MALSTRVTSSGSEGSKHEEDIITGRQWEHGGQWGTSRPAQGSCWFGSVHEERTRMSARRDAAGSKVGLGASEGAARCDRSRFPPISADATLAGDGASHGWVGPLVGKAPGQVALPEPTAVTYRALQCQHDIEANPPSQTLGGSAELEDVRVRTRSQLPEHQLARRLSDGEVVFCTGRLRAWFLAG